MSKNYIYGYLALISVLFTTCQKEKPEPPDFSNKITITTGEATEVGYRSAILTGTLSETYGQEITDYGHCWDSISKPTTDDDKTSLGSVTTAKSFSSKIDDIVPGKKYYTRVYFIIGETIVYGSQQSFTTLKLDKPVVETIEAINVGITSATLSGKVVDAMGDSITGRGFCYGPGPDPAIESDSVVADTLQTTGSFSITIDSLQPGNTYYARAYATNNTGIRYGDEINFTTKDGIPILTTADATEITATTAVSGGTITEDGGASITARGVCWSTNENPTTSDNKTIDGTGIGSFTSNLKELEVNTTYYVRTYATNTLGTEYGAQINFTTKDGIPALTTSDASEITATTSVSGGTITDNGGASITARGVCWSTNENPTTADNKTIDGKGTGSFSSNLTGLEVNTTYYVRAYATNLYGTQYGNQVSLIAIETHNGTRVLEVTNPSTGKTWMDRNLGASRAATNSTDQEAYGDLYQWGRAADGHEKRNSGTTTTLSSSDTPGHGDFILAPDAPSDWRNPQNDKLWQGVNGTNNPCPDGYRLPTEAEWEAERQSWSSDDAAGAFASPLKLPVPGNRSFSDGSLGDAGSSSYYWSSTVDGIYSRVLRFHSGNAYIVSHYRGGGYTVRCLKD